MDLIERDRSAPPDPRGNLPAAASEMVEIDDGSPEN